MTLYDAGRIVGAVICVVIIAGLVALAAARLVELHYVGRRLYATADERGRYAMLGVAGYWVAIGVAWVVLVLIGTALVFSTLRLLGFAA